MSPASAIKPKSLSEWFRQVAQAHADKTAIHFGAEIISYAMLAARVEAQANVLRIMQCQRGERIAYLGLNSPTALVVFLACMEVGAIYLPLNYRLARDELQAILDDAAATHLISDVAHTELARQLTLKPRPLPTESGDALLVYTSGTTGKPRGVVHTQEGLGHNALAAIASQGISAKDVVLSALPLFHVGGLCIQTLPALYAGATVVLHERFDPHAWLAALRQHRPSLSLLVPACMQALLKSQSWASTDFSCLRFVAAGSSIVPTQLIKAFHERQLKVTQVYGATETGPVSLVLSEGDALAQVGSVGQPAMGVTVRLHQIDKDGVGEIVVTAPNVARAYWQQDHADLQEHSFFSGDLAKLDELGNYTVVGRRKEMIISGGENIYPAEVENCLALHPLITEVAVVGIADRQWGEVAVAFVVSAAPLQGSDVDSFLQGKLAKFKWPKEYVYLKELPKTALGKVQKTALTTLIKMSR